MASRRSRRPATRHGGQPRFGAGRAALASAAPAGVPLPALHVPLHALHLLLPAFQPAVKRRRCPAKACRGQPVRSLLPSLLGSSPLPLVAAAAACQGMCHQLLPAVPSTHAHRLQAKEKETGAGTACANPPPPDSAEEQALRRAKVRRDRTAAVLHCHGLAPGGVASRVKTERQDRRGCPLL
jgi:hypothetical protein